MDDYCRTIAMRSSELAACPLPWIVIRPDDVALTSPRACTGEPAEDLVECAEYKGCKGRNDSCVSYP